MSVLLVRHGDALPPRASDDDRVLSLRGREETRALGRALLDRGLLPDRIVSSPLVRAVQTAELLAGVLGYPGVVQCDPALVPDGDVLAADASLRQAEGLVIAVTHEPIVRVLAARLLGEATHPPFRTSGCVLIEGGRAVLRLDPSTF
ncbi:MAG: histidine phosphatase family protein [Myxococcota bacterium]|nr:histidine phosphatase family protein [Myxococcota bacterium]